MANRIIFTGSNPNGNSVKVRWDRDYTDNHEDAIATACNHLNKEYA